MKTSKAKVRWKRTGEIDFVILERDGLDQSAYIVSHHSQGFIGTVRRLNSRHWGSRPYVNGSVYRFCARQDAIQFCLDVKLRLPGACSMLTSGERVRAES